MKIKQNKGITLIALVITIIVLLILAAVTINALFGENGILNQARTSKIKTENGTVKEQAILLLDQYQMYKRTDGLTVNAIRYLEGETTESGTGSLARKIASTEKVKIADTVSNMNVKTFMIAYSGKTGTYWVDYNVAIPHGSTGRGAADNDHYKKDQYLVEQDETNIKKYVLSYYDDSSNKTELLEIYEDGTTKDLSPNTGKTDEEEPTPPDPSTEDPDVEVGKEIYTIEDLVEFAISVNNGESYEGKKVLIKADLDFTEDSSYRMPNGNENNRDLNGDKTVDTLKAELANNGMIQIGNSSSIFRGILNGCNHTLNNVYLSSPSLLNTNCGTIKHYTLNNVTGKSPIMGTFVYTNVGTVDNLSVTGEIKPVSGDSFGAPFAGIAFTNEQNAMISNCVSGKQGETQSISSNYYASGIAYTNSGTITRCKNYYNLTGTQAAAGIVYQNKVSVINCDNYGKITSNTLAAGIIDINSYTGVDTQVTGCKNGTDPTNTEIIIESQGKAAGIIGQIESMPNIIISNCENNMNINGGTNYSNSPFASGIANSDYLASITVENCINNGNVGAYYGKSGILSFITSEGHQPSSSEGSQKVTVTGCTNTGTIGGSGSEYGNNAAGILSNCKAGTVTVTSCNNSGDILCPYDYAAGIVDYVEAGTSTSGAFNGTISNCKNSGSVKGNSYYYGGIVAYGKNINISNCENGSQDTLNSTIHTIGDEANTLYGHYQGGIIGCLDSHSNVTGCKNYMPVYTKTSYSAGIIGFSKVGVEISKCENYGDIKAEGSIRFTGGIIGNSESYVKIEKTVNEGDIKSGYRVGGIAGDLAGSFYIEDCINRGNVECTYDYGAGGIIGHAATGGSSFYINRTVNTGNITATSGSSQHGFGGIIGGNFENSGQLAGSMFNVFNSGNISVGNNFYAVGGIMGNAKNSITIMNSGSTGNITFGNNCYTIGGMIGVAITGGEKRIYNSYVGSVITYPAGDGIGGFVGEGEVIYNDCYYNSASTTGLGLSSMDSTGLTGKTEAEMKETTFKDLLNTNRTKYTSTNKEWDIDSSKYSGYPFIKDIPILTDE